LAGGGEVLRKRSREMRFSNAYIRAFVVSVVIFIGTALGYFQKYGGNLNSRRGYMIVYIAVVALTANTALVGRFSSRAEKPWPWLKLIVISIGCWLGLLLLMLLMVEALYSR
jgi:hypothetical protein